MILHFHHPLRYEQAKLLRARLRGRSQRGTDPFREKLKGNNYRAKIVSALFSHCSALPQDFS